MSDVEKILRKKHIMLFLTAGEKVKFEVNVGREQNFFSRVTL